MPERLSLMRFSDAEREHLERAWRWLEDQDRNPSRHGLALAQVIDADGPHAVDLLKAARAEVRRARARLSIDERVTVAAWRRISRALDRASALLELALSLVDDDGLHHAPHQMAVGGV